MNFRYMPYSDELANMILNHKDTNNKSDSHYNFYILENDLTFTDKILEKIRNLWNNLTGGING